MNIVYDSIIYDLQSHGGVSVYFSEILKRAVLDSDLDSCDLLSVDDNSKQILMGMGGGNIIEMKKRIFERYRDVPLSKYDNSIFHSSYYRLPSVKKGPVVTTVHDFTYERYVKGLPKIIHSWQKNRSIKDSDIIICVSNNTANDLVSFCNVHSDRIRVVYNGVSENFRPLPGIEKTNRVLFIGARGGYKNFHLAIESLRDKRHLELVIVGGGDLTRNELELLERYIPGRYKWLGRVTDSELNIEYNKALCLLYPSSYEGFGIPIIEAMRSGCPVIAVNSSSIPEVAGNAAILLDEPKPYLISEALTAIEYDSEQLVHEGYMQALKFSWDLCYQSTKNIYKELK